MLEKDLPIDSYLKITFPDDFTFTPTKTKIFSMDYSGHNMQNPFVFNKETKAKLITHTGVNPFYYKAEEIYYARVYYAIVMVGTYTAFP